MSFSTSENTKLSSSAPNVPRSAFTRSKVSPRTLASRPESRKCSLGVLTIRFSALVYQGCTLDVDAAPELRIVDQLAGVLGQQPHEFGKLGELLHLGNVPQIAGQDRREIGSRPVLPPPLAVAADRFGEAAEQDELDEIIADDRAPLAL